MSERRRDFWIGVDIGQKVDHSAICVIEAIEDKVWVKALVKFNLGTPWDTFVNAVKMVADDVSSQGTVNALNVDATGVGAVPAEWIQQLLPNIVVTDFKFTNQNKRELVGKVKLLHSLGKLKFAMRKGDEIYNRTISELMSEMKQLQMRVIKTDNLENPEIEVFKTGAHDDLFTALALAVKDININVDWKQASQIAQFVEDKTWVKTGLDEPTSAPIAFF